MPDYPGCTQQNNLSACEALHIAGMSRMGDDPKTSDVDKNLRCNEHRTLFIAVITI